MSTTLYREIFLELDHNGTSTKRYPRNVRAALDDGCTIKVRMAVDHKPDRSMPAALERFEVTDTAYECVATWNPPHEAGRIIRQWRESRGWSATQLARFCGVQSHTTPGCWERGEKQPQGSARETLLALLRPIGASASGANVDAFVAQLRADFQDPVERRFRIYDDQYDKNSVYLGLKCQGTVLPGVDVAALKLFFERHDKAERAWMLHQTRMADAQKNTTRAGRKWLEMSLQKPEERQTKSDTPDTTTSSSEPPNNGATEDKSNVVNTDDSV